MYDAAREDHTPEVAVVTAPSPARAAGIALAAAVAAPLIAAVFVGLIAAVRLAASGHERLSFGGVPSILLALGFGVLTAGALVALTRSWTNPRFATLVLTIAVSVAWPLAGLIAPAALVATTIIACALFHDHRSPGGIRMTGVLAPTLLVLAGLAVTIMGTAAAGTHNRPEPTAGDVKGVTATHTAGHDDGTGAGASGARGGGKSSRGGAAGGGESSRGSAAGGGESVDRGTSRAGARGESRGSGTRGAPGGGASDSPSGAGSRGATGESGGGTGGESRGSDSSGATGGVGAEDFVRAYYRRLNEGEYERAWEVLSPGVRSAFGGFARWKGGYAATEYSRPVEFSVGVGMVTHVLVARDRGCAERRFRVTWRLRKGAGGWVVTGLSAVALDPRRC
jgi:hypothetical protein